MYVLYIDIHHVNANQLQLLQWYTYSLSMVLGLFRKFSWCKFDKLHSWNAIFFYKNPKNLK